MTPPHQYATEVGRHGNLLSEEEEHLRQQQMVLLATENDEDEIIDLLGSEKAQL